MYLLLKPIDEENNTSKPVQVDIRFTAQQNAMNYYNNKKGHASKEIKTL